LDGDSDMSDALGTGKEAISGPSEEILQKKRYGFMHGVYPSQASFSKKLSINNDTRKQLLLLSKSAAQALLQAAH
jgi:hypothetical protein